MRTLGAHRGPGNGRELKNTLERALLLRAGTQIDEEDITVASASSAAFQVAEGTIQVTGKTLAEIEREAIRVVLETLGGNRRATARALAMARPTLQVRLKEMGLVASGDPAEPDDDEAQS